MKTMEKIVLNAEIWMKRLSNRGYICVNGNEIEGVFTTDYANIIIKDGMCKINLIERNFDIFLIPPQVVHSVKTYINTEFVHEKLHCPEQYLLFCQEEEEWMALSLLDVVRDKSKIDEAFFELEKVRP